KSIGRSSECFRMTAGIRSGKAIRTSVCFSGSLTSEHTREPLGRGSPSLGQERRPILLFKNEGAARALVCSGVTRSEKAFVSQCAPEAPIGVTFRQKALRYQRTAQSVLNRAASRPVHAFHSFRQLFANAAIAASGVALRRRGPQPASSSSRARRRSGLGKRLRARWRGEVPPTLLAIADEVIE